MIPMGIEIFIWNPQGIVSVQRIILYNSAAHVYYLLSSLTGYFICINLHTIIISGYCESELLQEAAFFHHHTKICRYLLMLRRGHSV